MKTSWNLAAKDVTFLVDLFEKEKMADAHQKLLEAPR